MSGLPIRARLTVWYAAVLAATILALGSFLVLRLRSDLMVTLDATLSDRADAIAGGLQASGRLDTLTQLTRIPGSPRGDAVAQLLTAQGVVLQSSGHAESTKPLIGRTALSHLSSGSMQTTMPIGPENDLYRILVRKLPNDSQLLVIAASTDQVEAAVHRLIVLLAVGGPLAVALSALVGYALAAHALRPVDRMTRSAAAITATDLSARLDVPALEDEVGRLGRTLNLMLARMQAGLEDQRRFTADASHELRTPLAILSGEIDLALRSRDMPQAMGQTLESLQEEAIRMGKIVEDLLTLARLDEKNSSLSAEQVDLLGICTSSVDRFSGKAEAAGSNLMVQGQSVLVRGDEVLLQRLLSNLIDNALKHTPPGGSIKVMVEHKSPIASVTVADTGLGIPEESLPHIFDRFYRVDKSRSRAQGGTGLGLAICRSIAEAHHAHISLSSQVGQGTSVQVLFPEGAEQEDAE